MSCKKKVAGGEEDFKCELKGTNEKCPANKIDLQKWNHFEFGGSSCKMLNTTAKAKIGNVALKNVRIR